MRALKDAFKLKPDLKSPVRLLSQRITEDFEAEQEKISEFQSLLQTMIIKVNGLLDDERFSEAKGVIEQLQMLAPRDKELQSLLERCQL
jgi:hypothetical protein